MGQRYYFNVYNHTCSTNLLHVSLHYQSNQLLFTPSINRQIDYSDHEILNIKPLPGRVSWDQQATCRVYWVLGNQIVKWESLAQQKQS